MKNFFTQPLNIIILVTCLIVSIYSVTGIYERFYGKIHQPAPLTLAEQKMQCLKLGSDLRARTCLRMLEGQAAK